MSDMEHKTYKLSTIITQNACNYHKTETVQPDYILLSQWEPSDLLWDIFRIEIQSQYPLKLLID